MQLQKQKQIYSIGLDIGIASVGWCVLGKNRIIDLGVRAFDKAETPGKGESLNKVRRDARLMRRRLRRRAWRLTKLARLLKRHGVIDDLRFFQPQHPFQHSLWQLRAEGLDRLLNAEEWARVIYHLCKHRGFHWISRAEEKQAEADSKGEGGKVKQGLAGTKRRMAEKGYRSAAEMVLAEFPDAQRNKQGDYGKALSRSLLADELALLFRRQRDLDNPFATAQLEAAILGSGDRKSSLFWAQKPPLAGNDLLKMLGRCTFEKDEYRAPKASFTAERHVWLTRLNNLRIVVDGATRGLNEAERRAALPLPYKQAGDFSYKQLRDALVKAGLLPDSFKFAGLAYPTAAMQAAGKTKDPEAEKLVRLPAWQELRKTLKDKGLETEWEGMAGAATGGDPELLDRIAWVLSVFKDDDDEVAAELRRLTLPGGERMIDALLDIRFGKFHALSLKALRKIVPHMETGLRYDEACAAAGYHHSQLRKPSEGKHKTLPPLYAGRDKDGRMVFNENLDVPRNPVVLRALNQARKVLNALIRRYGSPVAVHIEMARDLSRPLDERNKVKKAQDEYRDRNEKDKAAFEAEFNIQAKSREFEKFQLYREQQGKCAYSLEPLDLHRVLNDKGYAEVDHALPYRRSFDDSKNNKVLVLAHENQNKGNRTPYEYLDGANDSDRWQQFAIYVETNKSYRLAKRSRLLRKDFAGKSAEEFRERNLNDNRYICRFFKNYVEDYLKLASKSGADEAAATTAKRCVVVSGGLTSLLRARWGLPTSKEKREESDRHHAMDAAVVAACGHLVVQRTSTMLNSEGWAHRPDLGGYLNTETGEILPTREFVRKDEVYKLLPRPWKHFRDELLTRVNIDDGAELRTRLEMFGTYPAETLDALRPLFVSRAPQRRNSGAAHKATVYGKPRGGHRLTIVDKKTKISRAATEKEQMTLAVERIGVMDRDGQGHYKFTTDKLEAIVDGERNARMVHALRVWLDGRDNREKQAKEIESYLGRGKDRRELNPEEAASIKQLRSLPRKPCKNDPENGPFTGPVIRSVKLNAGKTSGIPVRDGLAVNDSMLRVDVFRHKKDGKYHLVPVYVHHAVAKEMPGRAIVAFKDETDWTLIDNGFAFCFSLHPNDLVRVTLKKETHLGYYASCNRSTGAINLWAHDRNKRVGKDGFIEGIGVKTAVAVEKFHVCTLGHIYPAPPEVRRGLA